MTAGRRRIDAKHLAHLAGVVRRILDVDFGGNQRAAEKPLGISQSHISQLLRGADAARGPGLVVLLRLREYSGMSLDEMLGLSPVSKDDAVVERLAKLEQRVAALAQVEKPPKRSTVRARRPRHPD